MNDQTKDCRDIMKKEGKQGWRERGRGGGREGEGEGER